jgi:hypothetical protein
LPPAFALDSCLAYSSTLKMEETRSSETAVGFQPTTRRYILEDRTIQHYVGFEFVPEVFIKTTVA